MASSEDFKKYIQAGKLTEALALAMGAAVKLQITTRVLGDEDMATGSDSQPGERIRTQINMVEGQITNEIGEQFTGKNPYKDLKQVHLEQVKEGAKTIQNNLKSLQKLFRLLVAMRQQNLLEVTPIDVTPSPELKAGVEQNILLPPMGGYEASGYEAIATSPESVTAAAYDLEAAMPLPDASTDYAASEDITASDNLASVPELNSELAAEEFKESKKESEKDDLDPLAKYGLLATAGAATVATAAAIAGTTKAETGDLGGRSVNHESLADLEPDDEPDDEFDDEFDDEDRGDATVIQLSTVAYSSSATYVSVQPLVVPDTSQIGEMPNPHAAEEITQDLSHEDWEDFGENLPVETVSQMPYNAAELMAATLDATQPELLTTAATPPEEERLEEEFTLEAMGNEPLNFHEESISASTGDENLLEEDWDGLELSPLSSTELSSFADTQEAAWDDDWEDEPEAIDLSRQMPPAPPIVMGYSGDDDLDMDISDPDDMDDSSWDDVEEEFKYVSSPTGKESRYANLDQELDRDLDNNLLDNDLLDDDLDDDFEIIGEITDIPKSTSNPFAAASDSMASDMEDIFGDLDENLLLSHDSRRSAVDSDVDDDFADFDFDEEPPSPHK